MTELMTRMDAMAQFQWLTKLHDAIDKEKGKKVWKVDIDGAPPPLFRTLLIAHMLAHGTTSVVCVMLYMAQYVWCMLCVMHIMRGLGYCAKTYYVVCKLCEVRDIVHYSYYVVCK